MTATILQFGTSRFLQAHADLLIGEALARGAAPGRIAVVQTTGDPRSRRRVDAFKLGIPYPVRIRGVDEHGMEVDRTTMVDSVATGFHAAEEWPSILALVPDLTHVVSNTGDRSYAVAADDSPDTSVPRSFPAKLLAILAERHRLGGEPIAIVPCELRPGGNGRLLKALVIGLARRFDMPPELVRWLDEACQWPGTVVDRIVSADLEPIGAVAEPYALWAIERVRGMAPICVHDQVTMTDDLDRYARLKVFLLNVAHIVMVERLRELRLPCRSGREAMERDVLVSHLRHVYAAELLPTFVAAGLGEEARRYVETTLRRFANPHIDQPIAHMLVDFPAKVRERVGGFLTWSDELGIPRRQVFLRRISARYGGPGS